jgi:tetratricopeptide (TPR) repeat protein
LQKNYEKALQIAHRSLDFKREFHGEVHREVALEYDELAFIYRLDKKYDISVSFYTDALAIKFHLLSQSHASTAKTLFGFALCLVDFGDYKNALETMKAAQESYLISLGKDDERTILTSKYIDFIQEFYISKKFFNYKDFSFL